MQFSSGIDKELIVGKMENPTDDQALGLLLMEKKKEVEWIEVGRELWLSVATALTWYRLGDDKRPGRHDLGS
jgi:hypothetical protein